MKKLTLVAAALFAAATSFAQTSASTNTVPSAQATANQHGKTVSAAAHSTTSASVETENKGEYMREVAQEKKGELKENKEAAKQLAKERKEQAKQLKKEQKEAAQAQLGSFTEAAQNTQTDATASLKAEGKYAQKNSARQADLVTEAALHGSAFAEAETPEVALPQDQEKPKKAEKGRTTEKTKKDQENHGKTVSTVAKETLEAGKEKGQEVKEVASAKRQSKPEKVDASTDVDGSTTVKAPKSAARPGRGAARGAVQGTTNTVTKTVGNATKAVKPVKVGGGVGVGAKIKVGGN
ncbi:MAG: hypothetical protein ACO1OQ_09240 [Rufibacter sp.]